jgi:hypothetical protein
MAKASRRVRVAPSKHYRVLVEMSPHEKVGNLSGFNLQHVCMPQPRPTASGTRHLHAFARGTTVSRLRKAGRTVKVLADADAEGKRLQKHIGKGDRFQGGRAAPKGVGKLV